MRDLGGAARIGRTRAVLLVIVALAAVIDLVTFGTLVAGEDSPGPDEVARTVVQAVADDDCSDIGDLLDDSDLPPVITSCIRGVPGPVDISDVSVSEAMIDKDTAQVTVGVDASGQPAEVVVELRRRDGHWLVTTIRPG